MKLDYKASNIAKAERKCGLDFWKVFTTFDKHPSMSNLLFLFEAGAATEEDFDAAFKKGANEVLMIILDGLSDAGFLGQEDARVIKRQLEELTKELVISQNSGDKAKK